MKAITIWQPWASLLAGGEKLFETRSWATTYRGPIAIHAASMSIHNVLMKCFPLGNWDYHPDYQAKQVFLKALAEAFEDYAPIDDIMGFMEELPTGCVIATDQELLTPLEVNLFDDCSWNRDINICLKQHNPKRRPLPFDDGKRTVEEKYGAEK